MGADGLTWLLYLSQALVQDTMLRPRTVRGEVTRIEATGAVAGCRAVEGWVAGPLDDHLCKNALRHRVTIVQLLDWMSEWAAGSKWAEAREVIRAALPMHVSQTAAWPEWTEAPAVCSTLRRRFIRLPMQEGTLWVTTLPHSFKKGTLGHISVVVFM